MRNHDVQRVIGRSAAVCPRSVLGWASLLLCVTALTFGSLQAGAESPAGTTEPADPHLNARGRAILEYFHRLQTEGKVLSGQFCSYGSGATLKAPTQIFQATGRWPAFIAVDYMDFAHNWVETSNSNSVLREYWQMGGLVSVGVHFNSPGRPEGGGLRDNGPALSALLTEGTPVHDRWMRQLDDVADGLEELQSAGIVVLWRPFHEMNGGWFWWGGQKPADFVRVWQHMFDYFTHRRGLHNLIWVYSPNKGSGTGKYYPGDRYVDLAGLDAYTDYVNSWNIRGFKGVLRTGKPVGFTEFGPHGPADPPGNYDYRRLLQGITANFPQMCFFLAWDDKWSPAANRFAREFYNDSRIVSRADLPPGIAAGSRMDRDR